MSDVELKPCPFCGSTNIRLFPPGEISKEWEVICLECQVRTGYGDKEEVIEAWNNRVCEEEFAIELLQEVLLQACWREDVQQLDSQGISAYADALRFLAKIGKVKIVRDEGRMVIAEEIK